MKKSRCHQIFTPVMVMSILVMFIPLWGEILHVPADYPTIQSAIDRSATDDVVLVAEGVYYENIDFKGKAITVTSHYYIDQDEEYIFETVINGCEPLLADKALDFATLEELLTRDGAGGWGVEKICLVGFLGCWLIAIGHAYIVGRKIDSQHALNAEVHEII